MHFICDKCKTKYQIPDKKIKGKILKLRCKKCDNTIVLKDPTAKKKASPPQDKPGKGKKLLRKAFTKSLRQQKPEFKKQTGDSSSFREDKTRISQIPDFKNEDYSLPEEWYLADERGQFGPMPLNELIARIKRGEPGIDAVVWKDGFNDWEPIEEVPELKSYRKHAPPPRKKIKSKPTSAIGSSYSAQTTNPSISQSQLQPALSQSQLQPNLNSGYRAMGSPQDTMAAGASQPPNSALLQQFQKSNQNKLVIALLAGFGAIAVLGLLYFVYNLGKEGSKQTPSDKKIANKLNNSAASNENQKTTKKPVTTNNNKTKEKEDKVVYILATDQNENNDDDKNHKKSSNGKSSKSKPASSNTSSNSGKSSSSSSSSRSRSRSRSRSDLKKTMATNKSRISRCYAITVRKGQSSLVDHSVKVHLKIKPSGKVSSISFSGGIPPIMKNCLVRNLRSFKFPKGSKNDSFTYTMHFSN